MEQDELNILIQKSKVNVASKLKAYNITLSTSEMRYILDEIVDDLVRTVTISASVSLPKNTTNKYKLSCSKGNITGYHPYNGVVLHIAQITDNTGEVRYYTNGKREEVRLIE